jgi:type I restriction enzyme, R subunit
MTDPSSDKVAEFHFALVKQAHGAFKTHLPATPSANLLERHDLFGPGQDKEEFLIFDFCQNFEFFHENPNTIDATAAKPIGERLFVSRVELVGALQEHEDEHAELLGSVKTRLRDEAMGMNFENFMVRNKRRAVEKFQQEQSWNTLDLDARMTLIEEVAGLPSAFQDHPLPAKQFDLLVLNAQLLLLEGDAGFEKLQKRMVNVASALEALSNVPLVANQMPLILDMQTDEFWVDITVEILEEIRRRLRGLVELIKPTERKIVITDFEDEIGEGAGIDLPNVGSGVDKGRFNMKVRRFIEEHRNHITLIKLHKAEPLTPQDLEELERFFLEQGIAAPEDLEAIKVEEGLGRFLRSLTGLDRAAAKEAFSGFIAGGQQTSDQLEFLDRIINALTETGFVDLKNFYESPYTDIDSQGIVGVFPKEKAKQIIDIVRGLNKVEAVRR